MQQHSQTIAQSQQEASEAVDRLMRQAEISRLTRNLKSKLALASRKALQQSPPGEQRRRAKTLEGALPSPRPHDTPRQRSSSRRSSITSISSNSSFGSQPSPHARIPRISSVNSIFEASEVDVRALNTRARRDTPHTSPLRGSPGHDNAQEHLQAHPHPQLQPPQQQQQQQQQQHSSQHNQHERELQHHHQLRQSPPRHSYAAHYGPTPSIEEPLPLEPQTPPPAKRAFPKTPERASSSDGANLLLHFAHSPGRATPRTPDFNMNDYLHFQTPSPARGQLTPRHMRWGSLNSALFQPAGPALPRPAGSGLDREA